MSEYLDKLISKAKGNDFFDDVNAPQFKPVARTETRAVRRDRLDKVAWDVILDQVSALAENVEALEEKHPTAGAAYEDLFNLLNQGDPRFVEQDRMKEDHLPQHALMDVMHRAEEFKYIRKETRYDEYNTALAMITMRDRMDQSLDQLQEAIDAINEAAQALAEALAAAEEALANGTDPGEAAEGLAQALAAHGIALAEGDAAQEALGPVMEKALRDAQKAIEKERETMSGYGLGDGELQKMDFNERRKLAERLDSDRMENLAKLLGRFRMYADSERRRKLTAVPAEKYDVEIGNNLDMLVPTEFNGLAMEELEDLFWLRWAKHELAQFKVRGIERAGKGPIILVCDESGSMGAALDDEGNSREAWSKAVALSLADQAFRDKRDFTYIGFSSPGQVWETTFEKGEMNRDQLIGFAEHFFCGGTAYEGPIQRAGQLIREYKDKGKGMPDVVFITDDACRVSDDFITWWNTLREECDVRCYGLQIGGEPYRNNLKDLSDRCMSIDSLNAHPEGVVELFRSI